MKYCESDALSGVMESCYLNPTFHPCCLGCSERKDCYGEMYTLYMEKARIMNDLLDDSLCLDPGNAAYLAASLGAERDQEIVHKLLVSNYCPDGRIGRIVKLAVEGSQALPVNFG